MNGMSFGWPAAGPVQPGRHQCFDAIVSSMVSLDRNIEGWRFPHAMDATTRAESSRELNAIARAAGYDTARSGELDQEFKAELSESDLYSRSYLLFDEGYIAFDKERPTWLAFCDDSHVSARSRVSGLALDAALTQVFDAEARMTSLLGDRTWAFDGDYGFLMAEADKCGTGLEASVTLHAPALSLAGLAETAFKRAMEAGFTVGGRYSRGDPSEGALFNVSLPSGSREAEPSSIARLTRAAEALADYERRARDTMMRDERWEILDVVGRALGRASGARLVSLDESAEIVSGLRLGVACGILEGMELGEVTDLWRLCRTVRRWRPTDDASAPSRAEEPEYPRRARLLRTAAERLIFSERYVDV